MKSFFAAVRPIRSLLKISIIFVSLLLTNAELEFNSGEKRLDDLFTAFWREEHRQSGKHKTVTVEGQKQNSYDFKIM